MIKDKHSDLINLEKEFRAYWSTQTVNKLTAIELHNKLNMFKQDLIRVIHSMRCPTPRSKVISEEFYKKWLCGRDENSTEEITIRKKMISTMRLSKRCSKMRNISQMRNISRDSKTLCQSDQLCPISRLSTPPEQAPPQVEEDDAGTRIVVRRKLIDSKSELKQSIFGFHQKPETDDFPTGITALLFDRTTKMVDAYDEYYKTKGLRSTTRPELL